MRSSHEGVAEARAVRLEQPDGRMRKVDGQHERAGPGDLAEEAPLETEASKFNLNYIKLDGSIAP